jgi:hypothetical protein
MGKFVSVEGCVLEFQVNGTGVSASGSITTVPSVVCDVGGKGVYRGPLTVSALLVAAPPFVVSVPAGGVATLVITPSREHETVSGLPVVVEGDSSASVGWTITNPSSGATSAGTVRVVVQSAGQSVFSVG